MPGPNDKEFMSADDIVQSILSDKQGKLMYDLIELEDMMVLEIDGKETYHIKKNARSRNQPVEPDDDDFYDGMDY